MGTTTTTLCHTTGSTDSLMLELKMALIGGASRGAYSRSRQVGMPSGPAPFCGFSCNNLCSTCSTEMHDEITQNFVRPLCKSFSCRGVKCTLTECRNCFALLAKSSELPPLSVLARPCSPDDPDPAPVISLTHFHQHLPPAVNPVILLLK